MFGWIHNPAEIDKVLATLPMPEFKNTFAPTQLTDIFFWEIDQKVYGKPLPTLDQGQDGFCVGFGESRAANDILTIQIALGNAEEVKNMVAIEPIYAGSRVEIGGQHNDYQDGSVGAWASKWLNTFGIILYGQDSSLTEYNRQRCKDWGAKGVPSNLETLSKQHAIKTVSQVKVATDCRDLMLNGYSLGICGTVSRTMKRQNGGFCPQTGNNWPHCQCLRGTGIAKGNRPFFVYCNSWGDYLGSENNQVELESGRTIELPPGHYCSDFESVESDLRKGDTFAYSHAVGFPTQTIHWLI